MSDKEQVLFFSQRFFFFVTTDKSGEKKPTSFNFFSIRLAGQTQAALWQRGFGIQSLLCSPRLFVIFMAKIYQKKVHINVDCTSLCISLIITQWTLIVLMSITGSSNLGAVHTFMIITEISDLWILRIEMHINCYAIFFKYKQQDATSYNILYYCQCPTCFRPFLRPSSGAQKLYTQYLAYDDERRNRLKHVQHWQ